MLKHPVRAFIYAVFMSYSIASLAAESNTLAVTLVSTADYQIGAEGLPDNRQRSKSSQRSVRASSNIQTKRHLVSLYGGESGERIPERGYLTDVVWGEQSTYPAASADAESITHERIVYYSFNVGPWKRKLNSETSVLTRAFMTQPLLVFLSDQDKAAIAGQLVKTPLFAQALALHQQQVNDPSAGSSLLDDYVEALGEQGVAQLTAAQKQSSGQVFQSRMKQQRAKMSATATSVQTGISFDNPGAPFDIFAGMDVNGKKGEQLEFTSYSSLYYGVQELADFNNTTGKFWTELVPRHFYNVPLIQPVTGWLDKDLVKKTAMGVNDIKPLATVGNSAQVVIFRNNPNTALDAPMAMNLMTAGALIVEVVGTSAAVFKPTLVNELMTQVQTFTDSYKPYLNNIAIAYSVTKSIQKLMCTAAEEKEGICGDYFKTIDSVANLLTLANVPLSAIESALKDGEQGKPFDSESFCGGAILEKAKNLFGLSNDAPARPRKSPLHNNTAKAKLAICAFDQIATQPLLKLLEDNLPNEYEQIKKSQYKSIMLSADFFKRTNHWNVNVGFIPKGFQLEALVAKLAASNIRGKEILQISSKALGVGSDTLKFVRDVQTGKVEMMPLFGQLYDALQDNFNKNGNQILSTAVYDVFKALTPTKYVQMAYTLGNKGTAIAWDWVTDPSVIKLTMTRDAPNTLAISTLIPDMKGVRYLKVPSTDVKLLDYSGGLNNAGSLAADDLLAVSNAPDTNHLLVYEGFKASVENQGAFLTADKGTIQKLLSDKKVNLMWHVKKFNNSAEIAGIPLSQRKKSTSFKNETTQQYNYLNFPIWEDSWANWVWGLSPIIDLEPNNPLNQSIFKDENGTSTVAEYQAMDFTKIYKKHIKAINLNPLKGDTYPLQHKTAGIYSDYTHIHIKSGADEKLYQNTFNIYVLPNLNAVGKNKIPLDYSLNEASRLYCEDDSCAKNSEIQLNFYTDTWDQIGQNGLWAVWMSAADGLVLSEPVAIREQAGNSTSTLRLPNNVSRNDYLVVYEDVMNGYLKHSGKSTSEVLRKAFNQRINYGRYPVIALQLSKLQTTTIPLLKPLDTDNDGVPDTLDAFPNDPNYAYDTDQDTLPDEWENQYGLDIFSNDAALDFDNDGINNLDEFKGGTDPAYQPFTLSGTFNNKQVILKWNAVKDAAYSVCRATERIEDIDNCRNYAGGTFINVTGSGTQYTVNGLTNGKTYYFRVIAENNAQTLAISNLLSAIPNKPATLNDTGISAVQCYQLDSDALVDCTSAAAQALNKKQDGMVGRDVTINDNSDGHAGFSFTKISSTGAALPVTANSWACVKDNVTGLIWENKTADGGLHDGDNTYTNYSADYGADHLGQTTDASGFVATVNQQSLCGASNWRLPSADELQSIIDYSIAYPGPTIDTAFFPNTQQYAFWSSSPDVGLTFSAWNVHFDYGSVYSSYRLNSLPVRLVRASQ